MQEIQKKVRIILKNRKSSDISNKNDPGLLKLEGRGSKNLSMKIEGESEEGIRK